MSPTSRPAGRTAFWAALPVLLLLVPLGYSVVSFLLARDATPAQAFLEMPPAEYTECIRETTYMRFHPWQLLRAAREEVVRFGKRGEEGLKKCGECHRSRERFCDRCHNAVSLSPDCWACHYYP
ncbi:MAG: hypothetical protein ABIG68_12810 [Acidobacteriota bacterium]